MHYGDKEGVVIQEIAKPSRAQGKVLVKVYASGINPIDWKLRQGYLAKMVPLQLPVTLGSDFCGVIEETGQEVYGQASILGNGSGALAEFALADANFVAPKPKGLSYIEAAALPLAGVSALQGLTEHIQLAKGQRILIHGGAGGIGSVAIQLAKHLGAYVATTASADDKEFVTTLGANEVIDYKKEAFEELLKDYDAVFDTVGGETYKKSFLVLRKGGVLVSMLEPPNEELVQQYGVTSIAQQTAINKDRLAIATQLVEQGVIKVHIDTVFPLAQAGQALEYLQTNHSRGKVVVEIRTS